MDSKEKGTSPVKTHAITHIILMGGFIIKLSWLRRQTKRDAGKDLVKMSATFSAVEICSSEMVRLSSSLTKKNFVSNCLVPLWLDGFLDDQQASKFCFASTPGARS